MCNHRITNHKAFQKASAVSGAQGDRPRVHVGTMATKA